MQDVKNIIAKNITELRLSHNMTQMDLAAELHYSNKTVSKWERAESSPDIAVLVEIADLFGVTVDELVREKSEKEGAPVQAKKLPRYSRKAITYVSESAIWVIAIFAFIITTLITNAATFQWLYFAYALPTVLIIRLVFNSIWFNRRRNYLIVSALLWSILAAVHITFLYFKINVALIYLLGVAGQIIIILCSFIPKPKQPPET